MSTPTPIKAKLFSHGRSQAVRLSKVPSSRPKASMQSLIEALDEFEPGLRLARDQAQADRHRMPTA